MGFFDRFKKPAKAPESDAMPSLPPAPLSWLASGDFEVASCPGKDALHHLEQMRSEGSAHGFTVILIGDEDDFEGLAENKEFATKSVSETLQISANIKVQDWLAKEAGEDPEAFSAELGEWPAKPPASGGISAHLDILTRKPRPLVYLAKIPTPRSWEAPVYIGMGGWNACPDSAVLGAFAREWHERYGAEIVSITHDVIEFVVARPPTTRDEAMTLAKEQYIFCNDIVDQGVGYISSLAATLLNSKYWYFWWD